MGAARLREQCLSFEVRVDIPYVYIYLFQLYAILSNMLRYLLGRPVHQAATSNELEAGFHCRLVDESVQFRVNRLNYTTNFQRILHTIARLFGCLQRDEI